VILVDLTLLKKQVTLLNSRLEAQTEARQKVETELVNVRQEASKTAVALDRAADALTAKTAQAFEQVEQITKLNGDAKELRHERDNAQAELAAYRVSMTFPQQAANAAKKIEELEKALAGSEQEKALLSRQIMKFSSFWPISDPNRPIKLPADLNPKVLVVDPKWHFVVLDAGEDQGVVPYAELLVSRGGKLVTKVRVKRVEKNRCVADLVTGWDAAEVMEGDRAIPVFPKS